MLAMEEDLIMGLMPVEMKAQYCLSTA